MRRIATRFRSGLSLAGPKAPSLVPDATLKKFDAQPTYPWHQVHNDERES